jgi:hypothetical protein
MNYYKNTEGNNKNILSVIRNIFPDPFWKNNITLKGVKNET